MTEKHIIPETLFRQYDETATVLGFEPFGGGHINETFLVKTQSGNYILQRVNKKVFRTEAIVHNYNLFLHYIFEYQHENRRKLVPDILKSRSGAYHTVDDAGFAWRLVEFVPDARSYAISPATEISYEAAKAMGRFQLFLNTLPAAKFDFTIIRYHDPERRLHAFEKAVSNASETLKKAAAEEIDSSFKLRHIVKEYNRVLPDLPKRVTHNDTKLDNMLFAGNRVLVIDLDTVMPSTVLFDYGDMVRTFTSPAAEDEKDTRKVTFRKAHFEALTKGYLDGLEGKLHPLEKENLLLGARAIIYEQVLRFLTDYLQGNPYYKVKYSEHNLVRTRTQIKLLDALESDRDSLQDFILGL